VVPDTATLTALSSPRRREILRLVWEGEQEAGAIHRAMPDVTFGAVSQHLKALLAAGLVEQRRDGRSRLYQARRAALGPVGAALESMWNDALWRLKLRAELVESRRGPAPRSSTTPRTKRAH
jgi:DNA-binding transcriptional ArsR family regulator